MSFWKKSSVIVGDKELSIEYGKDNFNVPYDSEMNYAVHEYASILGRSRLFDYFNDRLIAVHVKIQNREFAIGLDNTKYEWKGECEQRVTRYSYKPHILLDLDTWNILMEKLSITCFGEKRSSYGQ